MIDFIVSKIKNECLFCKDCKRFISHENKKYLLLNCCTEPNVGFCEKVNGYFETKDYEENICVKFKKK